MAVGDEREFEDYFRKEEPADLIPRLENVLERLDGDEQELAVAGEIVNYVIKQLEAMDEDTATDQLTSEPDEKDGSNLPQSVAASKLEPAAWMAYSGAGGAGLVPYLTEQRAERETCAVPDERGDYPQPLVRLSDVIAVIEEHRDRYEERRKKAFDNYMQAESEKNRRVHQSVAAQNQDRVETLEKILEEFTQLSEAE